MPIYAVDVRYEAQRQQRDPNEHEQQPLFSRLPAELQVLIRKYKDNMEIVCDNPRRFSASEQLLVKQSQQQQQQSLTRNSVAHPAMHLRNRQHSKCSSNKQQAHTPTPSCRHKKSATRLQRYVERRKTRNAYVKRVCRWNNVDTSSEVGEDHKCEAPSTTILKPMRRDSLSSHSSSTQSFFSLVPSKQLTKPKRKQSLGEESYNTPANVEKQQLEKSDSIASQSRTNHDALAARSAGVDTTSYSNVNTGTQVPKNQNLLTATSTSSARFKASSSEKAFSSPAFKVTIDKPLPLPFRRYSMEQRKKHSDVKGFIQDVLKNLEHVECFSSSSHDDDENCPAEGGSCPSDAGDDDFTVSSKADSYDGIDEAEIEVFSKGAADPSALQNALAVLAIKQYDEHTDESMSSMYSDNDSNSSFHVRPYKIQLATAGISSPNSFSSSSSHSLTDLFNVKSGKNKRIMESLIEENSSIDEEQDEGTTLEDFHDFDVFIEVRSTWSTVAKKTGTSRSEVDDATEGSCSSFPRPRFPFDKVASAKASAF